MARYLVISSEANWAYSVQLDSGMAYRLGRADDNDIVIKDRRVSSYHARINSDENDDFTIRDLESRNGTRVNGKSIRQLTLSDGDVVEVGHTTLQFVSKLDPSSLTGAAILSPRLSHPLLKTQFQRLSDQITALSKLQDTLSKENLDDDERIKLAESVGKVIVNMKEVETHTRTLIGTNHFHEIFHHPRPMAELFTEALRFVAGAIEAENAALIMMKPDGKLEVESTVGLSVAGWPSNIPTRFSELLMEVIHDKRAIYIRSMKDDNRWKEGEGGDSRAIFSAPVITSKGNVIGVAYFDSVHNPRRMEHGSMPLAEGCLKILADHLTGEMQVDSRPTMERNASTTTVMVKESKEAT